MKKKEGDIEGRENSKQEMIPTHMGYATARAWRVKSRSSCVVSMCTPDRPDHSHVHHHTKLCSEWTGH